jgi:hypothetical protein
MKIPWLITGTLTGFVVGFFVAHYWRGSYWWEGIAAVPACAAIGLILGVVIDAVRRRK